MMWLSERNVHSFHKHERSKMTLRRGSL